MRKFLKIITCLYAGIVAVNALEVKFDGKCAEGCDYIKFRVGTYEDAIVINEVAINNYQLRKSGEIKDVTLIVPGTAQCKQVYISEYAFKHLNSDHLRLKLKFEAVEDKFSNDKKSAVFYVKFPSNCSSMFACSNSITNIDLKGVDSKCVTNAYKMFSDCVNLEAIEFGNFDTSRIVNMRGMFKLCKNLRTLDLTRFCTQNVKDMSEMLFFCENLADLRFGKQFYTSNVTNMRSMFQCCQKLAMIDFRGNNGIYNFDTRAVQDMSHMFDCCRSLVKLDLGRNFTTRSVRNMSGMFQYCESLVTLDIGGSFNTYNVIDMSHMFYGCKSLMDLQFFEKFTNTDNVKDTIQKVLSENSKQVEQYKAGKTQLFGFFVGQSMKALQGKGNPEMVNNILRELLG